MIEELYHVTALGAFRRSRRAPGGAFILAAGGLTNKHILRRVLNRLMASAHRAQPMLSTSWLRLGEASRKRGRPRLARDRNGRATEFRRDEANGHESVGAC